MPPVCVCVCVCARARARAPVCACVCLCARVWSLCVVVVSAWVLGGWQCLVWLLGVCMMVVLFAEGHRDVEPMSQEALLEMKSLHRKRE